MALLAPVSTFRGKPRANRRTASLVVLLSALIGLAVSIDSGQSAPMDAAYTTPLSNMRGYEYMVTVVVAPAASRAVWTLGDPGKIRFSTPTPPGGVIVTNRTPTRDAPLFESKYSQFSAVFWYRVPQALAAKRLRIRPDFTNRSSSARFISIRATFIGAGPTNVPIGSSLRLAPYREASYWTLPEADKGGWRQLLRGRPTLVTLEWTETNLGDVFGFDVSEVFRACDRNDLLAGWGPTGNLLPYGEACARQRAARKGELHRG